MINSIGIKTQESSILNLKFEFYVKLYIYIYIYIYVYIQCLRPIALSLGQNIRKLMFEMFLSAHGLRPFKGIDKEITRFV